MSTSVFPEAVQWFLLLGFSALTAFLVIYGISGQRRMPAFDEMVDLACGHVILKTGDYHLDPGHTPFPRCLVALPSVFMKAVLPESWKTLDHWNFALEFVNMNGNIMNLIFWGRVMMMGVAILTGISVYLWARQRSGTVAALVSAGIYFFYPMTLGLAGFIGNDMPLALGITLSIWALDRLVTTPTWSPRAVLACGGALGLALLAKHTAAGLLPVIGLVLIWWALSGMDEKRWSHLMVTAVGLTLTAGFCILLAYRIVESRHYLAGWKVVTGLQQGNVMNYFHGEYSRQGWWYYYLVAFLIKTPIPLLAMCGLYLYDFVRDPGTRWRAEYPLLICLLVYLVLLSTSPVNIGPRYLYPVFPVLCVLLSGLVPRWLPKLRSRFLLAGFVALYVWPVVQVFPYYSTYFNEFVGGPKNGYKWLHEMEWPIDYDAVEEYARSFGARECYWATFDMAQGQPRYNVLDIGNTDLGQRAGGPVLLAVSATYLKSIMASKKDWFTWLEKYEPVKRIAYSTFIYDVTQNPEARRHVATSF